MDFVGLSVVGEQSDRRQRQDAQQVAELLRTRVINLLDSHGGGYAGLERAAARVEALRLLATVWKATAEEGSRSKFVDNLAILVDEGRRLLDARAGSDVQGIGPGTKNLICSPDSLCVEALESPSITAKWIAKAHSQLQLSTLLQQFSPSQIAPMSSRNPVPTDQRPLPSKNACTSPTYSPLMIPQLTLPATTPGLRRPKNLKPHPTIPDIVPDPASELIRIGALPSTLVQQTPTQQTKASNPKKRKALESAPSIFPINSSTPLLLPNPVPLLPTPRILARPPPPSLITSTLSVHPPLAPSSMDPPRTMPVQDPLPLTSRTSARLTVGTYSHTLYPNKTIYSNSNLFEELRERERTWTPTSSTPSTPNEDL
jgi:hypothetical protein